MIQVEGGAKDAVHVASTYGLQLLGEVSIMKKIDQIIKLFLYIKQKTVK